jgi:hypothetical protein
VLEDAVLNQLQHAIESIPVAIWAFLAPPALWGKAVYASPFVKTYRHGVSGLLSLLAGALLVATIYGGDNSLYPYSLIGAGVLVLAMFVTLCWPPAKDSHKRKVR